MARPKADGLPAFLMDVDFFTDPDIRRLRRTFGSDGPLLFLYILCRAYRTGYYMEYNGDFAADASEDLQCTTGKVALMVRRIVDWQLLRQIELRHKTYLTSAAIQRRYQAGMRNRGKARTVSVDGSLWILKKEETEGFIQVRFFCENCASEGQKTAQNEENQGAKTAPISGQRVSTEKTGVSAEKTPAIVVDNNINNTTTSLRSSHGAPKTGITAPSKEEIIKVAVEMGLPPELGAKFYYHYLDENWIDGKHRDVRTCWRWKLSFWDKEWKRQQSGREAAPPPPDSAAREEELDRLRRLNQRIRSEGAD